MPSNLNTVNNGIYITKKHYFNFALDIDVYECLYITVSDYSNCARQANQYERWFIMLNLSDKELASKIQHTNVNPELTPDDIRGLCDDCKHFGFNGVMIQPQWVTLAKEELKGTNIQVATCMSFPMGAQKTEVKVFEAQRCFADGADQLDWMPNVGFLKAGMYDEYQNEIAAVVKAAGGKVVKIMLEFGMLTREEKIKAAELARDAGATYLKNSSGWGKGGHATIDDIQLLKRIAQDKCEVKASGGIRTRQQALSLLEAGASLLGTSAGPQIITGIKGNDDSIAD